MVLTDHIGHDTTYALEAKGVPYWRATFGRRAMLAALEEGVR